MLLFGYSKLDFFRIIISRIMLPSMMIKRRFISVSSKGLFVSCVCELVISGVLVMSDSVHWQNSVRECILVLEDSVLSMCVRFMCGFFEMFAWCI